jgi:pyrroline-5-carboxylate reductase
VSSKSNRKQSSSSRSLPTAYGFVGTGEIAAAIVNGLSRDASDAPAIFLSPRGRDVARELASRFPNVQVCGSNQEVLENTSTIVLAVRPPIARAVLTELSFQPQHVLISAVAGVRLGQLRDWASPARHVIRTIPLPQAAHGQSLTVMYPDNVVAHELFTRVGNVLVPREEETLDAFSAATATFAAHLDYLTSITDWLADHGVDRDAASTYVTHIFGQIGQSLLEPAHSLAALMEKHTTPGGINEQLMNDLRHDGVPDLVRQALDRILTRLGNQPSTPKPRPR